MPTRMCMRTSAKGPRGRPRSYPASTSSEVALSTSWWRSLVWPTSSARVGHARLLMASSTPRSGKGPVMVPYDVLTNWEVKLVAAGQKKRRGSYESYLSFTPEEKAQVASVNGVWATAGQPSPRSSPRCWSEACTISTAAQRCSFVRVAVTKIKITKINSEGCFWLFTKFSTRENYLPYGITFL